MILGDWCDPGAGTTKESAIYTILEKTQELLTIEGNLNFKMYQPRLRYIGFVESFPLLAIWQRSKGILLPEHQIMREQFLIHKAYISLAPIKDPVVPYGHSTLANRDTVQ